MKKQNSIGRKFEMLATNILRNEGFWVLNIQHSYAGQPFDILAVKNNTAYAFDVKHCDNSYFYKDRIEPNQWIAMEYYLSKGNSYCGFLIYFQKEQKWCYLPFSKDIKEKYSVNELMEIFKNEVYCE